MIALALVAWLFELERIRTQGTGVYDFTIYYAAAHALRLDPHADIYSLSVLQASAMASGAPALPVLPFLYPVFAALVMAPLTLFSFSAAVQVWLLVNAVLLLVATLVLGRELSGLLVGTSVGTRFEGLGPRALLLLRRNQTLLIAMAIACWLCLISRETSSALGLGQIDFLVLLPLALVPWLTRAGHERGVGVAIALAAMLKVSPALLLGYLALRRRWEALASAVITLAVLSLGCIVLVGPHVFLEFVRVLLSFGAGQAPNENNEALMGPLINLVAGSDPGLRPLLTDVQYVVLAALAAITGFWLFRTSASRAARTPTADALSYGMALCAMALLSPVVWAHHYLWILPATIGVLGVSARDWLDARGAENSRRAGRILIVCAVAAVLVNIPLPYGWDSEPYKTVDIVFGLPLRFMVEEFRPLCALVILMVAAILLRHEGARHRSHETVRTESSRVAQPSTSATQVAD